MNFKFNWTDKLAEEYKQYNGTLSEFKRTRREWKILKFVHANFYTHFWELNEDGKYSDGKESFTLMEILSTMMDGKKYIHTVMRLSDGCIFSIGDKVSCKEGDFTITCIAVHEDGRMYLDNYVMFAHPTPPTTGGYINEIKKYELVEL